MTAHLGDGRCQPVHERAPGLDVGSQSFHRRRHLLPTLITTNKDLKQLEAEFPRLVDRCKEGLLVDWSASAWRGRA